MNRSIKALRGQKLIEVDKKNITVLALDGLIALAGFDPAYLHLLE